MADRYCDRTDCPCNIPLNRKGQICAECYKGNHMDWKTAERKPEPKGD